MASVCQSNQPCLELRQLNRWLVSPPPPSQENGGGWSSIYSLCSTISKESFNVNCNTTTTTTLFSSFKSSKKNNYELCTENLGCETGVVYAASLEITAPVTPPGDDGGSKMNKASDGENVRYTKFTRSPTSLPSNGGCDEEKNRATDGQKRSSSKYPPPLTTLSGGDRMRIVRRHEDGRLQLIPTSVPAPLTAERANGRLRLLREEKATATPEEDSKNKEEEEEEEGQCEGEMENGSGGGCGGGDGGVYGRAAGGCKEEDVVGTSVAMAVPWEAFWVAT